MIYIDTSFFAAHVIARDTRHSTAQQLEHAYRSARLATSNLVLGETWTLLRRRLDHRRTSLWLDGVLCLPGFRTERIDEAVEEEAWAWLRMHDDRPYSFVDATSFALMRKLRMREALAFGGDFAAAGFVELRP